MAEKIDWSAVPRRSGRQLGPRPPWFNGGPVSQIAIDPRARFFATMSERGGRVFHAASGELVAMLEGTASRGTSADSIAFLETSGHLLGRLSDRILRLWDPETGALVRAFDEWTCESLSGIDTRRERVLTRDTRANPVVVDLASGATIAMATRPFGGVGRAAFLAGDRLVALSSGDDKVFCWDVRTGAERWTVSHARFGSTIVAPPDADWFARGGKSGAALICDAGTGVPRVRTSGLGQTWVRSIAATADGAMLLHTSAGGVLFDVRTTTELQRVAMTGETCGALAPDGTWFVLGNESGELLRHPSRGNVVPVSAHAAHRAAVEAVAFDGAGNVVARERGGRTVTWNATGGAPREEGTIPADAPVAAWAREREREIDQAITRSYLTSDYAGLSSLVANDTLALSFDNYGAVRVWRRDGAEVPELELGSAPDSTTIASPTTAILHPDGRRFAVATTRPDAPIQLWDGLTGRPLEILDGPENRVHALAFDASGTRLAAGGLDRVVRVWTIDPAMS